MIFSYHPNAANVAKDKFSEGWRQWKGTVGDADFNHMLKTHYTSPIIWAEGKRRTENFKAAYSICLDFDGGVPLEGMLKTLEDYNVAIGTTKSHQIPKGEHPADDRFRVYLGFSGIQKEQFYPALYRYAAGWLAKRLGSDLQCIDAARMFAPVKEVVYANPAGRKLNIDAYEKGYLRHEVEELRAQRKRLRELVATAGTRTIPLWVSRLFLVGVDPGTSRNAACFRIGKSLGNSGFSHMEIVSMIMESKIPINQHVQKEVESAVRNGMRNSWNWRRE